MLKSSTWLAQRRQKNFLERNDHTILFCEGVYPHPLSFLLLPGKARRLKQAKEEAQMEVEQYRREREQEFQSKQQAVSCGTVEKGLQGASWWVYLIRCGQGDCTRK